MKTLVQVRDLKKNFIGSGVFGRENIQFSALSEVSFDHYQGEILAIVGESGSGKSTLARSLMGLYKDCQGSILFDGIDVLKASKEARLQFRRRAHLIFQDSAAALNPRMSIAELLCEPLEIHHLYPQRHERNQRIAEVIDWVGLPTNSLERRAQELSGGQRQRVGIARALVAGAEWLIFDEAVSALDVSIQAQIINLLLDLQKEMHLTYLFISHDLRVVEYLADRVAVFYLGRMVEIQSKKDLYARPGHPYTQALLKSLPQMGNKKVFSLKGEIPSIQTPPEGCHFHPRCHLADALCRSQYPSQRILRQQGMVRCHQADSISS